MVSVDGMQQFDRINILGRMRNYQPCFFPYPYLEHSSRKQHMSINPLVLVNHRIALTACSAAHGSREKMQRTPSKTPSNPLSLSILDVKQNDDICSIPAHTTATPLPLRMIVVIFHSRLHGLSEMTCCCLP